MSRYQISLLSALFFVILTMTGCEVIGGIFEAGMWTAVIIIGIIVALILYFVNRGKR